MDASRNTYIPNVGVGGRAAEHTYRLPVHTHILGKRYCTDQVPPPGCTKSCGRRNWRDELTTNSSGLITHVAMWMRPVVLVLFWAARVTSWSTAALRVAGPGVARSAAVVAHGGYYESVLTDLESLEQFHASTAAQQRQPVIIYFYRRRCRRCRLVTPLLQRLARNDEENRYYSVRAEGGAGKQICFSEGSKASGSILQPLDCSPSLCHDRLLHAQQRSCDRFPPPPQASGHYRPSVSISSMEQHATCHCCRTALVGSERPQPCAPPSLHALVENAAKRRSHG